jgi:hypothetical protein
VFQDFYGYILRQKKRSVARMVVYVASSHSFNHAHGVIDTVSEYEFVHDVAGVIIFTAPEICKNLVAFVA